MISKDKNQKPKTESQKIKDSIHLKYRKKLISEIAIVLIIGVIIIVGIFVLQNTSYRPNKDLYVEYDLSKDLIPDPIQKLTSHEIWEEDEKGLKVFYTKYATYDITGKVEAIQDYSTNSVANFLSFKGKNIFDYISPIDLTLSWGKLAQSKYSGHIKMDQYYMNTDRIVWLKPDQYIVNEFGQDYIISHASNNHLISLNKNIRNTFSKVKLGDIVRIQGYLVAVDVEGYPTWRPSSLIRNDIDNHSCEIIYVTDIVIMP